MILNGARGESARAADPRKRATMNAEAINKDLSESQSTISRTGPAASTSDHKQGVKGQNISGNALHVKF